MVMDGGWMGMNGRERGYGWQGEGYGWWGKGYGGGRGDMGGVVRVWEVEEGLWVVEGGGMGGRGRWYGW